MAGKRAAGVSLFVDCLNLRELTYVRRDTKDKIYW